MEHDSVVLLGYLYALLQGLGVLAAGHAVMKVRTAQGALAWAIALVFMPVLTLLPYLVFGRNRFDSYVRSRREADLAMQQALAASDWRPWVEKAKSAEMASAAERLNAVTRLAHMPLLAHNQVRLLVNGEATFAAIFAAIAAARKVVLVQFFIVHDDALGRRLQQLLLERAAAGVAVYLLYDSVGSHALPADYSDTLRAGGVNVHAFATRRGLRNRYQLNFRNHRKIVVVDGRLGYLGGHNVGDEYLGRKPPLAPWRDTHIEVSGPVLTCLQESFAEDWFWASRDIPPLLMPEDLAADGMLCQLATSGPADAQETCSLFFVTLINAARQRLWISSPYFVPDEAVLGALRLAVLRGVEVRILLPSRPDHRIVYAASNQYAEDALKAGVAIYRYQPGFVHQKVVLVDQDIAAIGSANLDNRSFRLNFEVMLLTIDAGFAAQVEEMLLEDFAHSAEQAYTARYQVSHLQRLGMRVARLLSPIL
ncbi:cardiolipin synthase [Pseudomonas sp. N040]|uniref:cardiolipin synthase n=1 Tax=Pseudomonas sp. N040 TaxID=2785325 RepID=UPI00280A85A5|nr:cardiolipin synthase [Pseudomonas sp. N040]